MTATASLPLADQLRSAVQTLAGEIGERHVWRPAALSAAADFIEAELRGAGYEVGRQGFEAEGQTVFNLEAERRGAARADEVIVVGAHYDTFCGTHKTGGKARVPDAVGTPGANDNGSGVAGLLALARRLSGADLARTVRFVAYVNEEPPFFGTDRMGSRVYAKRCRERNEKLAGVVVLETIGYYSDEPGSQGYLVPLAGTLTRSKGNFIGFLSNRGSAKLLGRVRASFARHSRFPAKAAAMPLPPLVPVGWSDDWAFWQEGYEAIAVTDTAHQRYMHYHRPTDTPEKLDYPRTAEVVEGLAKVIGELAG